MADTNRTSARNARPAADPIQSPLMQTIEFDESDPKVQDDRAPMRLNDAIAVFASAVGNVEVLARLGEVELTMQLARIAYTRARQVEREQRGERN